MWLLSCDLHILSRLLYNPITRRILITWHTRDARTWFITVQWHSCLLQWPARSSLPFSCSSFVICIEFNEPRLFMFRTRKSTLIKKLLSLQESSAKNTFDPKSQVSLFCACILFLTIIKVFVIWLNESDVSYINNRHPKWIF